VGVRREIRPQLVLSGSDLDRIFPVSGFTIGYVCDLTHGNGIDIGLRGQFTLNDMPLVWGGVMEVICPIRWKVYCEYDERGGK
jgi:hypothetical protein